MTEDKRPFKGVWVPVEIYLDRTLSWNAKIIYLEIDSFTSKGSSCFFSNEYLSKYLKCSVAQVTRYLKELKDAGWIEESGFDGRKRYLRTTLELSKVRRHTDQEGVSTPIMDEEHNIPNYPTNITYSESNDSDASKVKGKRKQKDKEEKNKVYAKCVDFWLKEFHPGWGFKAVDGKSLKGIIANMTRYFKNKNEFDPNEEQLLNFFRHFCVSLPDFYKNQTLTVLNSKFDSIIDEIKTGNSKKKLSAREYINSLKAGYSHS
jgi:DNA-binding MarR family transcriptional regulator